MLQSNKSEKGFTIVEAIVVIFIIAVISGIIFANYRQSGVNFLVQRTATKLAQDIRKAQQMAMSAEVCCGGIVPDGYGIYFDSTDRDEYLFYADIDGSSEQQEYDSDDTVLDTIDLEPGITITSSSISINFKPPDPITKIVGGDSLKIEAEAGLISKTVKFNNAGLIWTQ